MKTFITGHKSPDTDSIASALVMANLEKKLGNTIISKDNVLSYEYVEENLIIDKNIN